MHPRVLQPMTLPLLPLLSLLLLLLLLAGHHQWAGP
jgi:hypothetical protein